MQIHGSGKQILPPESRFMALGGMFCLRVSFSWLWEADSASGMLIRGCVKHILPTGRFEAPGGIFGLREADSWVWEAYSASGMLIHGCGRQIVLPRACFPLAESRAVVRCSVLQCLAVSCSVLQCLAVSCSVLQCLASRRQNLELRSTLTHDTYTEQITYNTHTEHANTHTLRHTLDDT